MRSASARLFAGTWRPLLRAITTLLCCDYFPSSSVVSHAFSALCVYSKFRHHPHPLDYLCAKFCFFRGLRCWASQWRKIAYSITHSLIQLNWCPRNWSACFFSTKKLKTLAASRNKRQKTNKSVVFLLALRYISYAGLGRHIFTAGINYNREIY